MVAGNVNNMLIPNVSSLPGQKKVEINEKLSNEIDKSEFKNLLHEKIDKVRNDHGIHLSVHAAKRLQERNLDMDSKEYLKLKEAIDKLKNKGGQEALVITDNAAYIVDVASSKIVTAIDKGSITDNVFTKIDSTLIV